MFKPILSSIAACALMTIGLTAPAHALSARAWVSGHGTDATGCGGVTNPCRSFQFVLNSIIAPGGEIDVLDPAGYGSMTINFAINIINNGVGTVGVIAPSGGNAVTINAGPSDGINLEGLVIEGQGAGLNGVQFNSGGSLGLGGTQIFGFTNAGVNFTPNNGSGAAASLVMSGGGAWSNNADDVLIMPQGGTQVRATLKEGCDISGSPVGVSSDGSASAVGLVHTTITDCVIHNITGSAVLANGPSSGGGVHVMVERDDISHTGTGLNAAGANAYLAVSGSTIAHSTSPTVTSSSGSLISFGNNSVFFVTNPASFTSTQPLQ